MTPTTNPGTTLDGRPMPETENENENETPKGDPMTTTRETTKPTPNAWPRPARGITPLLPDASMLSGKAASATEGVAAARQARTDAEAEIAACRKELQTAESKHRQALADAMVSGGPVPEDPVPAIEARLSEATRMSAAYGLAAIGHYQDLGNALATTDLADKGRAAANKRADAAEAKIAKLLAEAAEVAFVLDEQRRLAEWYRVAVIESRPGKWSPSTIGSQYRAAIAEAAEVVGVPFGGDA